MKPLHRGWWGHGALGSTLRVFSEAAGEAAELGETGPDHGLEHQVGGGGWHLGVPFSVQLGPASHPSPEALAAAAGQLLGASSSGCSGSWRPSLPGLHSIRTWKRGGAGPDTWGGLAQLFLPQVASLARLLTAGMV